MRFFNRRKNVQTLLLVVFDIIVFNLSYFVAIWLRYDFQYGKIPTHYVKQLIRFAPVFTLLTILLYSAFKLYKSILAYVGYQEALSIIASCLINVLIQYGLFRFFGQYRLPYGFYFIEFFLLVILSIFIRFIYRFYKHFERERHRLIRHANKEILTMLIGAGEAGRIIIRELKISEKLHNEIVCIIDDDPYKRGKMLEGIEIVGNRFDIQKMVKKYGVEEIIVAIPTLPAEDRKEILNICKKARVPLKTLPGIYQLISGEVSVSKLRDVNVEDLLGRDPVCVNLEEITGYLKDQVVLVTGAGGTIGSELCRQLASHKPKKLILFDIYENNTYGIQLELQDHYPNLDMEVFIGSVRDQGRLKDIFRTFRPNLVYHAAAHKHVPLMEGSPHEAIKNNVFGTLNVAQMAESYGCNRMVLISTDKAVNPTNIMGASKRLCEMIIQAMNQTSKTDFVAVRFGNVLGSSGSVIPIFKKQIEQGGPVTVTHPDIIRFFMTIPEAVSLVLQAGAYAKGGEIFILDMGEPVKIVDMARNLIQLSGFIPDEDIKIVYTGLRPGEKLYEEVLMDEEGLKETQNKRIRIGQPISFDVEEFFKDLENLYQSAYDEESDIKQEIMKLVPTYKKTVDGIPVDR